MKALTYFLILLVKIFGFGAVAQGQNHGKSPVNACRSALNSVKTPIEEQYLIRDMDLYLDLYLAGKKLNEPIISIVLRAKSPQRALRIIKMARNEAIINLQYVASQTENLSLKKKIYRVAEKLEDPDLKIRRGVKWIKSLKGQIRFTRENVNSDQFLKDVVSVSAEFLTSARGLWLELISSLYFKNVRSYDVALRHLLLPEEIERLQTDPEVLYLEHLLDLEFDLVTANNEWIEIKNHKQIMTKSNPHFKKILRKAKEVSRARLIHQRFTGIHADIIFAFFRGGIDNPAREELELLGIKVLGPENFQKINVHDLK